MATFMNTLSFAFKTFSLPLLLAIGGCGSSQLLVVEKLDPLTGVTVTQSSAPTVFYSDSSSRAAFARDFINVGPVQVNRMGQQRYFLWMGVWSTMPGSDFAGEVNGLESIVIFADGEPLELTLAGLTPGDIGVSESVYVRPSGSSAEGFYEVTADQLRFIAAASEIRLQTLGQDARLYASWNDKESTLSGLHEFVSHISY
jgi:hypothetical protein